MPGYCHRLFQQFGIIDILINNAGLQKDAAFDDMTIDQWNSVIDVNLTGSFLCARAAVREFKRRGVVKSVSCAAGKIICMSSVHELIPRAGHVNYAASRGGVMLMMKSIAQKVAPFRIRVIGSEAVEKMVEEGIASHEEDAVRIGNMLLNAGVFHPYWMHTHSRTKHRIFDFLAGICRGRPWDRRRRDRGLREDSR
jgi:NADP-dependent 3-hydroxy acid dehydrogenase YdfG